MEIVDLGRKLNYNLYLNYVAIGYAFFLPLSRAGIGVFSLALFALMIGLILAQNRIENETVISVKKK